MPKLSPLACSAILFVHSLSASAAPTGYIPESEGFPFACSGPGVSCALPMTKHDKIRHTRLLSCRTWADTPERRCYSMDVDVGQGGSTDAYGTDADALMERNFQARLALQASQDIKVYLGQELVSRYGECFEQTDLNGLTKTCKTWGSRVIGNGTAESPYRSDGIERLNTVVYLKVDEVSPGPICSGYIPTIGCPTAQASRDSDRAAEMCSVDPATQSMAPAAAKNPSVADPINILSGAVVESRLDLSWPIPFGRDYASNRDPIHGLGFWRHSHESRVAITVARSATPFVAALAFDIGPGQQAYFSRASGSAAFAPTFPEHKGFSATANSLGILLAMPSGESRQYDASGRLSSSTQRSGYALTYAYDGAGRLLKITDSYARALALSYVGGSTLIARVAAEGGASSDAVDYSYDGAKLIRAEFNGGEAVGYSYDESQRLVLISDELGADYARFYYDPATGKATRSHRFSSDGVATEQADVAYGASSITVTVNGADSVYSTAKDTANAHSRISSATIGGGATSYGVSYNSNGQGSGMRVGALTDTYSANATTLLPSSLSRATGGTEAYTWNASTRQLSRVVDTSPQGSRTVDYGYDALGNLTSTRVTPGSGAAREWSWTYGSLGKPATATLPNGSTTTYEYYPDDDSGSLARRGQLKSVQNALGHKATIDEYDERGRPVAATAPDGSKSSASHDDRGRVISSTDARGESTFAYDAAGQLKTATLPSGYSITFSHDQAHRLVGASDSNGDSATVAYDEHGNRVQEQAFHNSELIATWGKAYTPLGQVQSAWAATASEASSATYDVNGRVKSSTDGLGRASTYSYATAGGMGGYALPGRQSATLGRDVDNNITSYAGGAVTATTYAWNDFGEMISLSSPDSGNMSMSYNAAAGSSSLTDAAGIVHAYSRDALGRPISATHSLPGSPSMTETLLYDAGRVGYLDSVADSSSTQTWTWNGFGLPETSTRVVGSVPLSMSYAYDSVGQLSSMSYPSGMVVSYAWAGGRVSSVSVNGSTLISNIGYRPFSSEPVSWTWGAGGMYAKTFDADGKITGVVDSTGIAQATVFDAAMRLSTLSSAGLSLSASYTDADQLSSVAVNGQAQTFSFNANLNRTSKKEFSGTVVPTPIGGQSNLPLSMSGTALTYDARKNMTFNGRSTLSYDLRGNLSGSNTAGIVASYGHNAANQRVVKTVAGATTLFMHDEMGNLSGEYSAAGAPVQEHIHLGSLPIGVMAGGVLRQVHTDYLGSPRLVGSASAPVWRWDSTDPFGANAPSVQTLVYNRRFPGQYFDAETGLHENHHRTYDPKLGRYIQSDPLGLAAGKNPFNYVNQNPLNATDMAGLDFEVIHGIDSLWKGGIPHIALKDLRTNMVYEILPFQPYFARNGYGINMGWTIFSVGKSYPDFIARNDPASRWESVTLKATDAESDAAIAYMTRLNSRVPYIGRPYAIYGFWGDGVSCATGVSGAFVAAGMPKLNSIYPPDFFKEIMENPEYKKRIVRYTRPRRFDEK